MGTLIEDQKQWQYARRILSRSMTAGKIPPRLSGVYQILIHTYEEDVNLQFRLNGFINENNVFVKTPTSWETSDTFTEVGAYRITLAQNVEYQLTTANAGSIVYLDYQEGVNQ